MSIRNGRRPRLGFFTRVLDAGGPRARIVAAIEQIEHAERLGFDVAWVAQHHFHENEGGLPSPFVFLAHVAARTSTIRLGTAIVTLAIESALRVAEDAAELDLLSGGRGELGFGSGGTPSSFPPFGRDHADRRTLYDDALATVKRALAGSELSADGGALYPPAPSLGSRIWEATFSAGGAAAIGSHGSGLLLSKAQPKLDGQTNLVEAQRPLIEAYLEALPAGVRPRVMASRGVVVTDDAADARRYLEASRGRGDLGIEDLIVGDVDDVTSRLAEDDVFLDATDWSFQVHPVDPPHPVVLRSAELVATKVAPALGWEPASVADPHRASRPTLATTASGETA